MKSEKTRNAYPARRLRTAAILVASFVLVVASLIGWRVWVYHHSVSYRLAQRIALHDGQPVRFSELTPFAWEKVYFFGPYTPAAQIDKTLGFQWAGSGDSGIQASKGVSLIVFIKDGHVVEAFDQSRGQGDFSEIDAANGLTPAEAQFVAERRSDGWEVMRILQASKGSPTTSAVTPTRPAP